MIAIIKYNGGNVVSVQNALNRIGTPSIITDNPAEIRTADKVIFPGVGSAGSAMDYIRGKGLDKLIPTLHQPFLGICLGMQLMCRYSEENKTPGLNLFPVDVEKLSGKVKVPHIGWNEIRTSADPLFENVPTGSDVYFVHSYAARISPLSLSVTTHGHAFSSAIQKDNFYGVQFHPEKSGEIGKIILKNFISL